MPEVIGMRPPGDRCHPRARGAQPGAEVIVLAAPALKVLVVTVDALVIGARDSKVAAEQLGSFAITDQGIERAACMPIPHSQSLPGGYVLLEFALASIFGSDFFRDALVEIDWVSGHRVAGSSAVEMNADVIRWDHAIAIEEQQVRRGGRGHAFVPAAGDVESTVGMRRKPNGKINRRSELPHKSRRLVARTVVGNHDLDRGRHPALCGDRRQHAAYVRRALERGNENGDFGLSHEPAAWIAKEVRVESNCAARHSDASAADAT